jgi:hypothetical protein
MHQTDNAIKNQGISPPEALPLKESRDASKVGAERCCVATGSHAVIC